jgi:hypothetical protein
LGNWWLISFYIGKQHFSFEGMAMYARMFMSGSVRRFQYLLLGLLFPFFAAQLAQAAPVVVSVDHRVTVSYSNLQLDARKGILIVQARIKNRSDAALLSPLQLSFDSAALKNLRIQNAQGIGKDGRPYFDIKLPKGLLLAKAGTDAIKVVIAVERKDKKLKFGNEKTVLTALSLAQHVSAGVEVAPLEPRAEPYALKAGGGKVNVRFSVRVVGKTKTTGAVYLRRVGDRNIIAMNDSGKEGDLVAGDAIFGAVVAVDTTKLKTDSCQSYEAFMRGDRVKVSSSPFKLCVSAFPVQVAASNKDKLVEFSNGLKAIADEIIFTAMPNVNSEAIRRLAADINAKVVGSIPSLQVYQLKLASPATANQLLGLVAKLNKRVETKSATVNAIGSYAFAPNDPSFNLPPSDPVSQHGLKLVLAHDEATGANAWDGNTRGAGVTVVVLDTGLDRTHADFGTSPGNCQFASDDCGGANTDAVGHGTQVAGVIGAKTNNGTGVAGVAYGAKIHSIQASPDMAYTLLEMENGFDNAAIYVASHGAASVVNASFILADPTVLDFSPDPTVHTWTTLCDAINSVVLESDNVTPRAVVINAVGNSGSNGKYYPARCNDLNSGLTRKDLFITVSNSSSVIGGACAAILTDQRCTTSNFGSWVDIAAPGSAIRTTTLGNAYANPTGTSFSAPMVSGAAAILKSCGVPLDQIEPTLINSANVPVSYPASGINPAGSTPRLDIYRALQSQVPTASNLSAAESYTENVPLNLTNIVIASNLSGCATFTATLTLSNVAAGSLTTGTSGSVTSTFVGGVWTASGPMADVNALLAGVTFNPSPNYNSTFNIATSVTDGLTTITGSKAMTGIAVNSPPTGLPTISGTAAENQTLTANTGVIADADGLGAFTYQWLRNGVNIGGATGNTYLLGDADVGQLISVRVSYTDGGGTVETLTSSQTAAVANVNDLPTGLPTISGVVTEDQTLTANTGAIADVDGLGVFSYQWTRNGADIAGANGNTYTLGDADVGQVIRVRVSYIDGGGTSESLTSGPTAAVGNINDVPSGLPTISGAVVENQTLTAVTAAIVDADGLGAFSYQWLRNGVNIGGATGNTYTLGDADVGQTISVRVSYTDGGGTAESLTSNPTGAVGNVNDAPTGLPTITGAATEDQTLTANTGAIADVDGLGAFTYQWLRNGVNIGGATGSTYILGDADVGQTISVRVSYTDGGGTAESLTSNPTAAVGNVNDAPTGLPSITGSVAEDQTLTANTGAIADVDGLGAFGYQWLRNGANIGGATLGTYILGDADVGQTISVRVSYTDLGGTPENLTSAPTAAVANVNDVPTGKPVIDPPDMSGNRNEGQILTALTNLIDDVDGLGPFHYQWWRDMTAVGGDSVTYTLQNSDLGGHMKVCVSYTDGYTTLENVCSDSDSTAVGDPHILTVDGLRYDFQGAGEFVALRGANGMQIQLRMEAVPTAPPLPDDYTGLSSGVSVNTAVAARVGKRRVSYQPDTAPNAVTGTFVLRVDGAVTVLPADGIDLGDGGRVLPLASGGIQIDFPDQTTLMVNTSSWPFYGAHWLHVNVFHTPAYEGIMGARSKGSWLPRLSNGSALGAKPASLHDRYVDLYVKFADSWRVNKDTSLFDYADGTSTAFYANKAWPTENGPYAAANVPVAKPLPLKDANLACRDVAGKIEKANCVFDVRVMGHKDLAKGHLLNQKIRLGAVNVVVRPVGKLNAQGEMVVTATVVRHATVVPKMKGVRAVPAGAVQFMLGDKPLGKPVKLDAKGQAKLVVTRQNMERFNAGKLAITAQYLPAKDRANVFLPSVSRKLTPASPVMRGIR